MEDLVQTILDLNEDITALQNRVKYEQNKGVIICFQSEQAMMRHIQKVVELELMGLKDIATFVDEKISNMMWRRIRNIESIITEELIAIATGQKKYLEERDKNGK